ncbi:MAG: SidA/IucD/PvdA family monooxygenase [Actinomycetales bacterium]
MTVVVVGGGPAMLGLLTAASREQLDELAREGLVIVDAASRERFGAGQLGRYRVRSDTRGRVFTEYCEWLEGGFDDDLDAETRRLMRRCSTDEPVPLTVAGRLLRQAGQRLVEALSKRPRVTILDRTELVSMAPDPDGVELSLRGNGGVRRLRASTVVLGIGGAPRFPSDVRPDLAVDVHSDSVLRDPGLRALLSRLDPQRPRVAVVGGSHSAFAVAGRLLRTDLPWTDGSIRILHRSPILMTYSDVEAARADGQSVAADDICPATGLVHRFGGLRTDAAALYRRVRSGAEPRVRLVPMSGRPADELGPPDGREQRVWATGYDSPVRSLLSVDNHRAASTPTAASWDGDGRLVVDGRVSPRVLGMGLGTARPRTERTGGEPAFTGSIDGVWFYQRVVAPQLLELLTA